MRRRKASLENKVKIAHWKSQVNNLKSNRGMAVQKIKVKFVLYQMYNSFNSCPIDINNTSLRREKYHLSEYVKHTMATVVVVNWCANMQCVTLRPFIYP